MTTPASNSKNKWLLPGLALALVATGIIVVYFVWIREKPGPGPVTQDLVAAAAASTRGVAQMERYQYVQAEKDFDEAVRLAPEWTPAKINLGIAIMNQNTPETKARAEKLFRELQQQEPENKHVRYCLGILLFDQGKFPEAYEHFTAVSKLDPEDPHTWLRMGDTHPGGRESPEAIAYYENALKLNPNMNSARYAMAMALRVPDMPRARKMLEDKEALFQANWEELSGIKYSEMGKYADCIGRDPSLIAKPEIGPLPMFDVLASTHIKLAKGVHWSSARELDSIRVAARARFGGTIVVFDYNRDGKNDVLMLSAVSQDGKIRDLLLRNDGGGTFTDVTAAAGLAAPRPSLGAAAGDYDNDGKPDLIITGAGEQHLFRNKGDGTFEDVSAGAGLNSIKGVCLCCGWIDLDQDSDVDLVICQYAESPEKAGSFTLAESPGGEVMVFENIGVAPPAPTGNLQPPLSTKFRKDDRFNVARQLPAIGIVATDFDSDHDVDLYVIADGRPPLPIANDRLMRFHAATMSWAKDKARPLNGGLALDANHDERSDVFLISNNAAPIFQLTAGAQGFVDGHTNCPGLRQAVAMDIDMDGWTDIVGLGPDGKASLLHNQANGRLDHVATAFGETANLNAVGVADVDGDGLVDLLLWTTDGLQIRKNLGNGNRAVHIDASGFRRLSAERSPNPERTNADGIGAWVVANAGQQWTGVERTTISAGLGQSLLPTTLGIGKNTQADAVRIRWPDGVLQAELAIAAGSVYRYEEYDRKPSSCPVLMTWDGERFVFVTDILGAGSVGESNPDGTTRAPRPEESIKIEANQLKPKNGQYIIKLAEPMDEVMYIDRVQLVVVDHPSDTAVFPDERFATSDPQPTQEILALRDRRFPQTATDHRGRDVTSQVLKRDRKAVDGFAKRSWLGYAEDHSLTLDFGDVPTNGDGRWFLVLASWTEYAYPETIYGAERAGVPLQFPVLERLGDDGKTWEAIGDLGFPAGLPRVMTRELTGFKPGKTALRIRTNMQVYWDQVFLAQTTNGAAREHALEPASAELVSRGFIREILPDGKPPVAYDDSRLELVPVTKWKGNVTRLGDVTELLTKTDDRFAIGGPGDEISVRFDATKLPELPTGWTRSFVLRTWGYCKDTAPTTQTGDKVGPLPFRAMKNYPDFGDIKPPATDAEKWNTRPVGGR